MIHILIASGKVKKNGTYVRYMNLPTSKRMGRNFSTDNGEKLFFWLKKDFSKEHFEHNKAYGAWQKA